MTPYSPKEDAAFAAMTLDILGNILSRAEDPGELGLYLTEEIRELTGARCVLLLQSQFYGINTLPRLLGVNPHRRKAWAKSQATAKLFEAAKALPGIQIWRGREPSETADYLRREGFELSLGIPFSVGANRLGAMLVLGLPDELHLTSVVDLLSALSPTLALVLRNAFLFEKQEQIIQDRTAVLQETNEKLQSELTERKRAEEAVLQSERKYRELVENANSIILRWSTDGTITFLNEFGLKFFGYQESEIIGHSVMDTIVPESESSGRSLTHLMGEILNNPQSFEHNINENRCRDGRRVWIAWTNKVVLGDQGELKEVLCIGTDITERKQAEEELKTILRTTMDGFYLVDMEGKILETNDAYCQMIGYSKQELLAMSIKDVEAIDTEEVIKSRIQQIMATGHARFETKHRRKDGGVIVIEASCNFLPYQKKGLFCFIRDITERKQAEENLIKAKEAAETANQAKDQFIAVLSHELRTPLTPVLATVTALNAGNNLPPEVHADLEMIRQNIELEARLIDDLLDVTRIAKGKMTLLQEPMDAHACLRTAVEICQSEIKEKRLDLSLDLHAARHHVHGDATRLRQVFWNLLKNSAKFTPPGGSIRIQSANENERLIITITDTGIGIEPELLPEIFNQFKQGEVTKIRRFGGLGLGLSIAKTVVEMHHGILTATSEGKGKGANFTVVMDTVAAPSVSPRVVATAPPAGKNVQGQRVLLVEDHADTLRILEKLLKKWGYSVTTAQSVRAALELSEAQPFDLLVSDLGLPDGSGLEVMRRLKERHSLRGIAVSGYGTDEDIRQSREAGFEDHLIKPINYEALRSAVQRIGAALER